MIGARPGFSALCFIIIYSVVSQSLTANTLNQPIAIHRTAPVSKPRAHLTTGNFQRSNAIVSKRFLDVHKRIITRHQNAIMPIRRDVFTCRGNHYKLLARSYNNDHDQGHEDIAKAFDDVIEILEMGYDITNEDVHQRFSKFSSIMGSAQKELADSCGYIALKYPHQGSSIIHSGDIIARALTRILITFNARKSSPRLKMIDIPVNLTVLDMKDLSIFTFLLRNEPVASSARQFLSNENAIQDIDLYCLHLAAIAIFLNGD